MPEGGHRMRHPSRPARSTASAVVLGMLVAVALSAAPPAHGRSALEGSIARHAQVDEMIQRLHERKATTTTQRRLAIMRATARIRNLHGRGAAVSPARFTHLRRELLRERRIAAHRIERSARRIGRRVDALRARRRSIAEWISRWGVFRRCPIRGRHAIDDDFGTTVRLPGVPLHRHMGNDISAPAGTPIVAPFDGNASSSSSTLGGLEVRVTGARGHIYAAHLSSIGALGAVEAGTVVGYVGATGDATAAHLHLEWHPGGGPAVDPHRYLAISCG